MSAPTRPDRNADSPKRHGDALTDRPDERARREQDPEDAVEESAELVESETEQDTDLPPQEEAYGGEPDHRARRGRTATAESVRDRPDD